MTRILYKSLLIFFATLSQIIAQNRSLAEELSRAFQEVAKNVTDSVVSIQALVKRGASQRSPFSDPFFDQFRRFFGDDFPDLFPRFPGDSFEPALGTGVVVSDDGIIITNDHVVGKADTIKVTFSDGKEETATRVGSDPRSDIAVLRVKRKNLKPLKLGDSDELKVGEWVIAVGNPFGLANTITAGIVSAKGRSIMGGNQYEDFIQTDAAINPGNSGGPLVNLRSEVVGINTAIFSRTGGYMGIGFAIPINMVKNVKNQILQKGRVIRSWMGVSIQKLTPDLARSFGFEGTKGALVGQVQENTPAERAGVQVGDIIIEVDGVQIIDTNHLRNLISSKEPGTVVEVKVFRKGTTRTLKVKLAELPENLDELPAQDQADEETLSKIGLTVKDLTPELARQLKTKRTAGAVVTQVRPGSVAQLAGFVPQDIIIEADGLPITGVKSLQSVLTKERLSKGIRFIVENRGVTRFIFLRMDE